MLALAMFQRIASRFQTTYGGDLERYILSRDPKSAADVERLTQEYQYRQHHQSQLY